MADLSEFHALSVRRSFAKPCPVGHAVLKRADREALLAALDERSVSNKAVALWLGRRGVSASWQAVRSHRQGECSCVGS